METQDWGRFSGADSNLLVQSNPVVNGYVIEQGPWKQGCISLKMRVSNRAVRCFSTLRCKTEHWHERPLNLSAQSVRIRAVEVGGGSGRLDSIHLLLKQWEQVSRIACSLGLSIHTDRASTASGSLFQCLTTLPVKRDFLYSGGISCVSVCARCLLSCLRAPWRRVWLIFSPSRQVFIYTWLRSLSFIFSRGRRITSLNLPRTPFAFLVAYGQLGVHQDPVSFSSSVHWADSRGISIVTMFDC